MLIKFYIYALVLLLSMFLYSCKTVDSGFNYELSSFGSSPVVKVDEPKSTEVVTYIHPNSKDDANVEEVSEGSPIYRVNHSGSVAPYELKSERGQVYPDTIYVKSGQEAWDLHRKNVGIKSLISGGILLILSLFVLGPLGYTPSISLIWVGLIYLGRGSSDIRKALLRIKVMTGIVTVLNIIIVAYFTYALILVQANPGGFFDFTFLFQIFLALAVLGFIISTVISIVSWVDIVKFGRLIGVIPPKN